MTDKQLLLRNILIDPKDDLARLIYADLMEEVGDLERAKSIRHAVKYPNEIFIPSAFSDADWRAGDDPVAHQYYRMKRNWDRWIGRGWRFEDWSWRRGFVSHIICNMSYFMDNYHYLLSNFPIERISLLGHSTKLLRQFGIPNLTKDSEPSIINQTVLRFARFYEQLPIPNQY